MTPPLIAITAATAPAAQRASRFAPSRSRLRTAEVTMATRTLLAQRSGAHRPAGRSWGLISRSTGELDLDRCASSGRRANVEAPAGALHAFAVRLQPDV